MDLFINAYGTKIGCTGERLTLQYPGSKRKKEYPIRRIDKVVILRPASLTTSAVKLALEHEVDIVYLGNFGKPVGRMVSSEPKGLAQLRRAQLLTVNSDQSLKIAKILVKGKCVNQIDYLRYLGYYYQVEVEKELLQAETILDGFDQSVQSKEQLLGAEGRVADRYFTALRKFFRFPGRKPQGRDKFNSALNYGYGILYNEIDRLCLYVGLDPFLGLYHSERYGKPSLVLDLVEEFRVPIVDSVILPLFIEKKFSKSLFFQKKGENEYQLSTEGKAIIVGHIMKRMNQVVLWRGKRYPLKLVMENQVRSLARYFLEKDKTIKPFTIKNLL